MVRFLKFDRKPMIDAGDLDAAAMIHDGRQNLSFNRAWYLAALSSGSGVCRDIGEVQKLSSWGGTSVLICRFNGEHDVP